MQVHVIKPQIKRQHKKERVCIYIRESTVALELENSMENQERFFTEYVAEHPEWKLTRVYKDFGISGYSDKREQFQEMLQDAREGKFEILSGKWIQTHDCEHEPKPHEIRHLAAIA